MPEHNTEVSASACAWVITLSCTIAVNGHVIKIRIEKLKDKVRLCVFNSGHPIPKEALDMIWTSFYKVDHARTRSYGGFLLNNNF